MEVTAGSTAQAESIKHAILLMQQQDYTLSKNCTDKAQNIFRYLCVALNYNYSIANNLNQLYKFFNQEIIRAEIRRDPEVLNAILPLVSDMRDTWVQAEKLIHMK